MSTKSVRTIQVIEKDRWYWVWKPHGIPTTRWNESCFLEVCDLEFCNDEWWKHQKDNFSKEDEWWLINRLDNDTAWYIWFIKDIIYKNQYHELQSRGEITKQYVAVLDWHLIWMKYVDIPMMHHRSKERMICATPEQVKFWTWSLLFVWTTIVPVLYDEVMDQTWVSIEIKKWARHQIRCHCSFIWFPVVWDSLYGIKSDYLQLYSVDLWWNN